jgi:phosphoesterase RecJ-like protein
LFFYYSGEILDKYVAGPDLVILLDSSDFGRLVAPEIAEEYKKAGATMVQIDHHSRGDLAEFVDLSYINSESCSASEIVFNLLNELGVMIDKNIATCLLAGIVGDTSSFQNQNTTKECFAASSELMKRGARLRTIVNNTFGGKEVDTLKVWGLAMERLYVDKHFGIVSTYLTYEDIEKYGLSAEATSGIVNFLNSIKDAKAVVLITEQERGIIKVSLRTRDEHVDVAKIARQLGGGGHIKAAAFSIPGSLKMLTEGGNNHIVIV